MKYFAEIENNIVKNVIVVEIESDLDSSKTYIEGSLDGSIRSNPVGIGCTYDSENDVFILPKPFSSWVLNETSFKWEAPETKPVDAVYGWDESTTSWYKMKDFD